MNQYQALFEAVRDAIFLADLDTGMIVDANRAGESLCGRSLAELRSLHHTQLHPPERAESARQLFVSNAEIPTVTEGTVLHKDGRRIPVEISSSQFEDPDGRQFMVDVYRDLTARNAARENLRSDKDVTKRKRAEEALRESLLSIYNTVRDPIFHLSVEHENHFRFVSVNSAFLRTTGLRPESVVGKTVNEVIPEPSLTIVLGKYRQAIEGHTTVLWEETSDYPAGRLTGEVSIAPVFDDRGTCTHLVGSVHDITERKRAEAALRASEERFRDSEVHLMEAQRLANVGSWEMDIATEKIRWSSEMFRIYGRTGGPPENFGDLLSHVHPKDHRIFAYASQQLRAKRTPVEIEYRVLRPDGELRFVRSIAEAVSNDKGVAVRIVGATQDITGQILGRELLRESEERLKNAERIAHVGNWRSDRRDNQVIWSEELYRIFGVPQDFVPSYARFLQMVVPKDRERVERWVNDNAEGKGDHALEFQIARPTGDVRTIACIIETLRNEEGAPVVLSGICQDITDSRRAQDEALARRKLESVGTLASGIAHDFNNLLGAVLAQADLALAELADGSSAEKELQGIREVAVHGAEIVRQLMIYAGRESESLELVNVSRIVREMLTLLKLSASKNAVLETRLADDLPAILANPSQLRQIAMNLVGNASEAIGPRRGTIRLTTARVRLDRNAAVSKGVAEGDYLSLEVSDNGGGMPLEIQTRVFDPFFTTKSAGRGLGLAVVQGIVRNLHGTIHLWSESGVGTRFQILLPFAETAAEATVGQIRPAKEVPLPLLESTVLVVEDEDTLRSAVSKLLRRSGFQVLGAGDGSAAIDLLQSKGSEIDVILLDMTIPGRSSQDVVAEATRAGIKVILTSAYSEEMVTANLRSPVVCGFIRKPFRHVDLVQVLGIALSG